MRAGPLSTSQLAVAALSLGRVVAAAHDQWVLITAPLPAPTNPCESTTTLDPVTVTRLGDNQYVQAYLVTYDVFCDTSRGRGGTGLCPHECAVTQTCDRPVCRERHETGCPPGFTEAPVVCPDCDGGSARTEMLTFPTESAVEFRKAGYEVAMPLAEPTHSHPHEDDRGRGQSHGDEKRPAKHTPDGHEPHSRPHHPQEDKDEEDHLVVVSEAARDGFSTTWHAGVGSMLVAGLFTLMVAL